MLFMIGLMMVYMTAAALKGLRRQVRVTRAQLAQRVLRMRGEGYSLKDYPYAVDILNRRAQELILKTARQVAKSTLLAVLTCLESTTMDHWSSLFLSPTKSQTTTWSALRLGKIIRYSPYIQEKFVDPTLSMGIWRKEFTNGSTVISTYAYDDGDRARGNSGDRIMYDECQDIILTDVAPVVNEAAANSEYGYITYTGTPKHVENTIEVIWQQSTQREWVMKCPACGQHQFITRAESIDKKGLRCLKKGCRGLLNPREGFWHPMNLRRPEDFKSGFQIEGYHLPQPVVPRNVEEPRRWQRLLQKLDSYSPSQFSNEVLGVSTTTGTRFITKEDLRARCRDYTVSFPFDKRIFRDVLVDGFGDKHIYAGVDWSGEGDKSSSYTALWIWGMLPGNKLKTLYFKLFPKGNPVACVDEIARICVQFGVKLVVGDAGGNNLANKFLASALGKNKVLGVQYGSYQNQVQQAADKFLLDRTSCIDTVMALIKRGHVFLPHQGQVEPFFEHILCLYEHITKDGQGIRVWQKSPAKPDDMFHAMIFAWIAVRIGRGDFGFYDLGDDDA